IQSLLMFGILWLIASKVFPDEQGSYLDQLKNLTPMFLKASIAYYFYLFAKFFGEGSIWMNLYYVLFIFLLVGIWLQFSLDRYILIFSILYLAAIISWPSWQGPRFIFPLLPIVIYFIFQGMKFYIAKLPEKDTRIGQRIFYGFWSLIIMIFL